jgi:acetyl-CoA synthetase
MARTILHDTDRYVEKYWEKYKKQGWYLAGDSARIDEDGYYWVIGRIDDVIKVSGYRLGSAEIESALVSHPAVAEAAAIGLPDELRGNIIHTTVVLREGFAANDKLGEELKKHVENEIGPIAKPAFMVFADKLPKTRSGKIMRRVIKAEAQGLDAGDISTLEE